MALLKDEYEKWLLDLNTMMAYGAMDRDIFAKKLANSLKDRQLMFKLLAVDMAALDSASRMENLVSFKAVYGQTLDAVANLIRKFFPDVSEEEVIQFNFVFFPFLYGVHGYTVVTEKQKVAMKAANLPFQFMTKEKLIENCVKQLLANRK